MDLSPLSGNEKLKDQLSRQERGRGLSHAYIISGPPGSGRGTLARQLTAAMLCTGGGERPCGKCGPCVKTMKGIHPDVFVISGAEEGKPITVNQVRDLRSDAYILPNEGKRKIYLLEGADRMNPPAQNAMLKLLEEGPPYAAFFLIASSAGGLLQTVRSRCEELALVPAGELERCEAGQEECELTGKLADALERAGEAELLETALSVLEARRGREELSALLDELADRLTARAARGGDQRRLLRAAELVKRLRGAAMLNVNGGQLAGWLCAGMFEPL